MTSYVRTFRFWEKFYNTKLDDSNDRLQSQLEYHRKKDENGNKVGVTKTCLLVVYLNVTLNLISCQCAIM